MKNILTVLISIFIISTNMAQEHSWKCVKGGAQSKFPANPESKLNAKFKFDYQINSIFEVPIKGKAKRFTVRYYVNSQDGSLFFPDGILWMNNFNKEGEDYRFDGAVRLANGQMGIYLYDKKYHKKRVFTVASKKSATDNFLNAHLTLQTFFNDRNDPEIEQENPEPLPPGVDWSGILHGYTGYIYNSTDKVKLTIYLDEQPMLSDKTSVPVAGFLAGVLNYLDNQKCNALIVFSKIENENGDYMQEELQSIGKSSKSFNGSSYKPFGLTNEIMGGPKTGIQNMQAKMAEFQAKGMALANKVNKLQQEKDDCIRTIKGDPTPCRDRYDPQIKKAKDDAKKLQYDLMKKMGVEDMMKN
jgi:hypothetical protein